MVRNIRRDALLIILAIVSWIFLTAYTLQVSLDYDTSNLTHVFTGGKVLVKNIFLTSFFLFVFLLFRGIYTKTVSDSLEKSIWPSDFINAGCFTLHLIILVFEHLVVPPFELKLWLNIINNFNILVETIFCANCFYYFKTLILHRKTKRVNNIWNIFEFSIYISMSLSFLNVNLDQIPTIIGLSVFGIITLYLSTQMKWVAYQKRANKIKYAIRFSVFLVTLILVLQNIFFESVRYGDSASHLLVIDSAHKFFILAASVFVMFYCISSILILLFHLPTSSVFDQKINETYNFKQLTKNLPNQQNSDEILTLLLQTCISTTKANAGWIYRKDTTLPFLISEMEVNEAKTLTPILQKITSSYNAYLPKTKLLGGVFKKLNIKSLLHKQILVNNKELAFITLIKDVENGFDFDIQELVDSYIHQTSTVIENQLFLEKALENERYREEKKIAQDVKFKLLDKELVIKGQLDCHIFFESTDMVGGDFFDSFRFKDGSSLVVLGDVSGHGTSAAFNMSQLNGVFHSIVNFFDSKESIPERMNTILNKCLSQNSFVSLSFFFIDAQMTTITHTRCGHNPAIIKRASNVELLTPKGIGLGILDKKQFDKITETIQIPIHKGDSLICYTDGITETVNEENEQFGEKKLVDLITNYSSDLSALEQCSKICETVNLFRNNAKPKDDSTCLIIKF